jgi:SAM-dependent methyltransferase
MPYRKILEREGLQYVGCDITPEAPVRITPGVRIPLPDHESRLVTSFQVLEHVWDLDWYLGECRRLLHPEGYLLLSTHGTWLYHPHPTDFRRWTCDGLVRELEGHGFVVERIDGIMGPLAWTTQFRLLGFREVLLRLPVVRSLLLPPLVAAMNLRMAFEDAITPDWIRQANASIYLVAARPSSSSATPGARGSLPRAY